MFCKKCKIEMKEGTALQNTLVGLHDFVGDLEKCNCKLYKEMGRHSTNCAAIGRGSTVSRVGPAKMVDVWKCPDCGHSVKK